MPPREPSLSVSLGFSLAMHLLLAGVLVLDLFPRAPSPRSMAIVELDMDDVIFPGDVSVDGRLAPLRPSSGRPSRERSTPRPLRIRAHAADGSDTPPQSPAPTPTPVPRPARQRGIPFVVSFEIPDLGARDNPDAAALSSADVHPLFLDRAAEHGLTSGMVKRINDLPGLPLQGASRPGDGRDPEAPPTVTAPEVRDAQTPTRPLAAPTRQAIPWGTRERTAGSETRRRETDPADKRRSASRPGRKMSRALASSAPSGAGARSRTRRTRMSSASPPSSESSSPGTPLVPPRRGAPVVRESGAEGQGDGDGKTKGRKGVDERMHRGKGGAGVVAGMGARGEERARLRAASVVHDRGESPMSLGAAARRGDEGARRGAAASARVERSMRALGRDPGGDRRGESDGHDEGAQRGAVDAPRNRKSMVGRGRLPPGLKGRPSARVVSSRESRKGEARGDLKEARQGGGRFSEGKVGGAPILLDRSGIGGQAPAGEDAALPRHSKEMARFFRDAGLNPDEIDPGEILDLDARRSPYWAYYNAVQEALREAFAGFSEKDAHYIRGWVEVVFMVNARGRVKRSALWIKRAPGPGREILVELARRTVLRAAPFPPIPPAYHRRRFFIRARFYFGFPDHGGRIP